MKVGLAGIAARSEHRAGTLRDIAEHSTEGRVIYNGRERAGAKRNTGIAVSRYPERESEHKENPPRLSGYII